MRVIKVVEANGRWYAMRKNTRLRGKDGTTIQGKSHTKVLMKLAKAGRNDPVNLTIPPRAQPRIRFASIGDAVRLLSGGVGYRTTRSKAVQPEHKAVLDALGGEVVPYSFYAGHSFKTRYGIVFANRLLGIWADAYLLPGVDWQAAEAVKEVLPPNPSLEEATRQMLEHPAPPDSQLLVTLRLSALFDVGAPEFRLRV